MYPQPTGAYSGPPGGPGNYGGPPGGPNATYGHGAPGNAPTGYGGPQGAPNAYGGPPGASGNAYGAPLGGPSAYGGAPSAPNAYGGSPGAPSAYGKPGGPSAYGGPPGGPNAYGGPPGGPNAYGGPPGAPNAYGGPPGGPNAYGGPGGTNFGIDPETATWFQAIDADRSGQITAAELQQALTTADWSSFNLEACRLIIKMFDRNNTGTVGINEFQAVLNYIKQWQGTFQQFDNDRSGFIEHQELDRALNAIGYRFSPQFISVLISKYDQRSQRRISMDSFFLICIKLQVATEVFKSKDTQMRGEIDLKYDDFATIVFQML